MTQGDAHGWLSARAGSCSQKDGARISISFFNNSSTTSITSRFVEQGTRAFDGNLCLHDPTASCLRRGILPSAPFPCQGLANECWHAYQRLWFSCPGQIPANGGELGSLTVNCAWPGDRFLLALAKTIQYTAYRVSPSTLVDKSDERQPSKAADVFLWKYADAIGRGGMARKTARWRSKAAKVARRAPSAVPWHMICKPVETILGATKHWNPALARARLDLEVLQLACSTI